MDLLDGGIGVDHLSVGLVLEAKKQVTAKLEGFAFFKFVGLAIPDANTLEGDIDGKVEDDQDIRTRCEGFILGANLCWVDSAGPLVGHGGEIIAVEDDNATVLNGGGDDLLDMFTAVPDEIVEFLLDAQPACGGTFSEFTAPGAIGGFEALDDLVTILSQGISQHGGLGGFPGSIDALDDDQLSLV